ncbi:MAG TPA: DUF5320 domain-containing protein [Ignavibacteriaceae bacterium]|nr:DUF5320 domain-containing protein [Ignavibacteriaceae bacterium]
MPGFDKTGPEGQGPMTGRKRGMCREEVKETKEQSSTQSSSEKEVLYGVGRGGRPYGGGRGNCFVGGRRKRGFGNGRRAGR